jgi:hypothetical protein
VLAITTSQSGLCFCFASLILTDKDFRLLTLSSGDLYIMLLPIVRHSEPLNTTFSGLSGLEILNVVLYLSTGMLHKPSRHLSTSRTWCANQAPFMCVGTEQGNNEPYHEIFALSNGVMCSHCLPITSSTSFLESPPSPF